MIRITRSTSRGYTAIQNDVLRAPNLSLKAKGLLGQLLSHEDGWQQSVAYCRLECADGRDAIGAALRELEAAGYCRRTRRRGDGGRWVWDHEIRDEPFAQVAPCTENPSMVAASSQVAPSTPFPSTVRPSTEKASIDEEPLDEEPHKILPAAPARRRNEPFDTLAVVCGINLAELTPSAGSMLGRALSEIRDAEARASRQLDDRQLAGEIAMRAQRYATRYPHATRTPTALAKRWPELGRQAPGPMDAAKLVPIRQEEPAPSVEPLVASPEEAAAILGEFRARHPRTIPRPTKQEVTA